MRPTIVTLRSDPAASAVGASGREGGALFIDPYRGTVLGGLSPLHHALHEVVEWHRWLGSREIGRPITGASAQARDSQRRARDGAGPRREYFGLDAL